MLCKEGFVFLVNVVIYIYRVGEKLKGLCEIFWYFDFFIFLLD